MIAPPSTRAGGARRRLAPVEIASLVVLPVIVGSFLWRAATQTILAYDARVGYLPFAREIAHGSSPYPTANLPPFGISLFVPFTAVPRPEYLLTLIAILIVPAILFALDVRDWRCYGAVFVWAPVLSAIQTVNLTLPLVLAAALAWRWRDRPGFSSAAVGLSIAAKLISAPLIVWLAATRRVRAAVLSIVISVGVTVGLLAVIQTFGGDGHAQSFVGKAGSVPGRSDTYSYSPIDFASAHGLSRLVGGATVAVLVMLLCGLCVRFARHGDDARSFAAAGTAIVVFAPNIWLHSLCFLLLPLGLLRPRFDWVWLVPFVLIPMGVGSTSVPSWLLFWAVALLVAGWSLARPLPRRSDVAVPDERPLARAAKASAGEST